MFPRHWTCNCAETMTSTIRIFDGSGQKPDILYGHFLCDSKSKTIKNLGKFTFLNSCKRRPQTDENLDDKNLENCSQPTAPAGKGQTQILNAIIFQSYGLNVVDEARSYVEGEHAQPHFDEQRRI